MPLYQTDLEVRVRFELTILGICSPLHWATLPPHCNKLIIKMYIARRKYQTPIGEDIKAIQQFYLNCPMGYEVDHIIPISKGGAHSLENLQYLTKQENRRKSNKIL